MMRPSVGPGTPAGGGAITPVMPVRDSVGSGEARPAVTRSAGTPVGRRPASGVCTSISSAAKLGPSPSAPSATTPRTPRSRTASFVPGRSSASNDPIFKDRCFVSSRASSAPSVITTSGIFDARRAASAAAVGRLGLGLAGASPAQPVDQRAQVVARRHPSRPRSAGRRRARRRASPARRPRESAPPSPSAAAAGPSRPATTTSPRTIAPSPP